MNSDSEDGIEKQDEPKNSGEEPDSEDIKPDSPLLIIKNIINTPEAQPKTDPHQKKGTEKVLSKLALIIAIAAAGFAAWEAWIIKVASEEQLRARISPIKFEMIEDLGSSPNPLGHILFKNLGQTPATKVAYYIETGTIEGSQWSQPGAIERKVEQIITSKNLPPCKKFPLGTTDFAVHPSRETFRSLQFRFKSGEIDAEVKKGRKFLMVVGCFVYETFDEPRFSSFCGYIDPTADPDPPSRIKRWYPALCRDGIGNSAN